MIKSKNNTKQIFLPKFRNSTERGLFEFMLSEGYATSTTFDYIHRLRTIAPLDELVQDNIAGYITDYTSGAHKSFNRDAHNAYSSALRCLERYAERIGVIIP